jgi:uncharacterized metal-binding protein YceD (DUF177 family)
MSPPVSEFSRIVKVQDLPQDGADYEISANGSECADLAARFGLIRIDGLNAKLRLDRRARGAVRLTGKIMARVTQTCVVTLEPVGEEVDIDLDIVFRPDYEDLDLDNPEFDNPSDFEPLIGESLDIAEIVTEEMALSLNPYPRAPTAPMIGPDSGDPEESVARPNPFAVLEALKPRDTKI